MTIVLRNDYDLISFLDVLESWMNVSSLTFNKNLIDSSYRYVISHDVGEKWSTFVSLMLQTVFSNMGVKDLSFQVTDGIILFSVPKLALRAK